MTITIEKILQTNAVAFEHLLHAVSVSYPRLILSVNDSHLHTILEYVRSDAYIPSPVLDGVGRPYETNLAKRVLLTTAFELPLSTLESFPENTHSDILALARRELADSYDSESWYTLPCYSLRMRPLIEGSRKSLEGYLLNDTIRSSIERVAPSLGMAVVPRIRGKAKKDCTVIHLTHGLRSLQVQVKGVNSSRHHPERAKILARFAEECLEKKAAPLPILVGVSAEVYPEMESLRYMRQSPSDVIAMNPSLLDATLADFLARA